MESPGPFKRAEKVSAWSLLSIPGPLSALCKSLKRAHKWQEGSLYTGNVAWQEKPVLKYTTWFLNKYFFNACNYRISRINVVMSL